jgi:chromosomal replication initiation ATPase DnaA
MTEFLSLWPERGPLRSVPAGRAFVDATIREVADRHKLTPGDLTGPSHVKALFRARAEAMWIIYKNTKYSYPQVARFFNRDHTTVIRACKLHAASLGLEEAA